MSMTLGFDVGGYLEVLLDDRADGVAEALARHAPGGAIRVATHDRRYRVTEISRDSQRVTPADEAEILAAMAKVAFVDWSNMDAPEGVPPLILPGAGWDVPALLAEPAMRELVAADRFCARITSSDQVKRWVDARARKLLAVAEKHRLVTRFG